MNDQEEPTKISKYNSAVAQLYRLDNLWQRCHEHRLAGRLNKWNDSLDCVWTELAPDSSKKLINKYYSFQKKIIKYKKNRNILYQILMLKEIYLRTLQNNQGKGTSYQDEFEDDFD